jgi:hypothetical protein
MSPVTATSSLTIPADVLKFAEEQKVVDYLSPLIELTHRVYPMAKSFELLLDEDPEIEGDCHILFHVVLFNAPPFRWGASSRLLRLHYGAHSSAAGSADARRHGSRATTYPLGGECPSCP